MSRVPAIMSGFVAKVTSFLNMEPRFSFFIFYESSCFFFQVIRSLSSVQQEVAGGPNSQPPPAPPTSPVHVAEVKRENNLIAQVVHCGDVHHLFVWTVW